MFQEPSTWQNPKDQQIYQLLKDCGPQCREGLIKKTGLPSSTIYDALKRLMAQQLVQRFAEKTQAPGRPRVYFETRY
jgi:predicted transcriptional regulator